MLFDIPFDPANPLEKQSDLPTGLKNSCCGHALEYNMAYGYKGANYYEKSVSVRSATASSHYPGGTPSTVTFMHVRTIGIFRAARQHPRCP